MKNLKQKIDAGVIKLDNIGDATLIEMSQQCDNEDDRNAISEVLYFRSGLKGVRL